MCPAPHVFNKRERSRKVDNMKEFDMAKKTKKARGNEQGKVSATSTERARKQASAEIQKRLDKDAWLEATDAPAPKPRKVKAPATPKVVKTKKVSALDAAAKVLSESKEPMRAVDMIAAMEKQGLWKSPGGKTPEATLYAAIIREIAAKGKESRFKKHERGLFLSAKKP